MPLASVIWVRVLRVPLGTFALSNITAPIPQKHQVSTCDELYISWRVIHCPELRLHSSSKISHQKEETRNLLLATTRTITRPCILEL